MVSKKTTKRKRGRPPKKPVELPTFNNEMEIREYILNSSLELALECKEIASKKNNIKQHNIANAKNQQYKTALTSLKVANDILKDLQLNRLEEKIQVIEDSLNSNIQYDNESYSSETIEKIGKLHNLTEQLAQLKE